MKNTLLLLTCAFVLFSCNNKGDQGKTVKDSIPACIRKDINAIEKKTMANPPVQVDEYEYNGKKVFLYTADCCDQFNTLYDENCKPVCSPSGGFEGGGDHKCEDFSEKAKHIKLIWKRKD